MRRPLPTLTPVPPLDCPPRGQDGRTQPELVRDILPRVLGPILAMADERAECGDTAREDRG